MFVIRGSNGICSTVVPLQMSLDVPDYSLIYLKKEIAPKHLTHLQVSNISRGQSRDAKKHCCCSLQCFTAETTDKPLCDQPSGVPARQLYFLRIPLLLRLLCLSGLDLLHQAECGSSSTSSSSPLCLSLKSNDTHLRRNDLP